MICPNCGHENPEGREFCQSCGAPLSEPAPSPVPSAPPAPSASSVPSEAPPTSGLAVASLIMGIVGWFVLPLVGGVLAVVFGHMAKREIAQSEGRLGGDGLATAGLVLGYLGVGLWLLGLLAFILVGVGFCGCGACSTLPFLVFPATPTG